MTRLSSQRVGTAAAAPVDTSLFAIRIVRTAEELYGVAPEVLLDAAGAAPGLLEDPLRRLPLSAAARLVEHAVSSTGDELLGLRAGLRTRLSRELGLAGVLLSHAPTPRTWMEDAVAVQNATSNVAKLSLEEQGNQVALRMRSRVATSAYTDQTMDFHVGLAVSFSRYHSDPLTKPCTVELRAERLARIGRGPYEAVLDREIVATRDHTGVGYAAEGMLVALDTDRDVYDVLRPVVEREAIALPKLERTSDVLSAAIERNLERHARALDLAGAARLLGVSPRTLQQRLYDEDTSLQVLLDEARRRLALRWLEQGLAKEEVSVRLGYSESSAFRRAWRRWHA